MERTEEEPLRTNDNDDSFTSIHWLWAHISSQLIYFVLLQYASFPNIVSTLHEKVKRFLRKFVFQINQMTCNYTIEKIVDRKKSTPRSRLFDVVTLAIHIGQYTTESGTLSLN